MVTLPDTVDAPLVQSAIQLSIVKHLQMHFNISDACPTTSSQQIADDYLRSNSTTHFTAYFDIKDIDCAYISKLVPAAMDIAYGPQCVRVWDSEKLPLKCRGMATLFWILWFGLQLVLCRSEPRRCRVARRHSEQHGHIARGGRTGRTRT